MKGQVISLDLFAAVFIFLIVTGVYSVVYLDVASSQTKISERISLENEGFRIMESLLRTPGLPDNWEDSTTSEYSTDSSTAGLWHLNEGSGSATFDSSGNGNNGTIYNNGVVSEGEWVSGQFGTQALNFDTPVLSTPDKIEIAAPSGSNLDIKGSLALEAWIKPTSTSGKQGIIVRNFHSALWLEDGKVNFGIDGFSGFDSIESSSSVNQSQWAHVAGVYDSAGSKLRIFIDGDLDKETDGSVSLWYTNSNPVVIGNSRYAQLGSDHCCPFDGVIEEVRISNSSRSGSEFNVAGADPLVIGLSSGNNNILDSDKIDAFVGLNYTTTKQIFDIPGYEYYINFMNSKINKGRIPSFYSDIIFNRRLVFYNNSADEIIFRLWKPLEKIPLGSYTWITTTQEDFDAGAHSQTSSTSEGNVELSSSQPTGAYTSRIFDAEANARWDTIDWSELIPYKEHITNDGPSCLDSSIKGLWYLDENSGEVIDSSLCNQNGVNSGASRGISGKINTAYYFDGNDYINLEKGSGDGIFNTVPDAFTASAWIKPETTAHMIALSNGWDGTFWIGTGSNPIPGIFAMGLKQTVAGSNCGNYNGNWHIIRTVGQYTPNNWYHVVGVYNKTDKRAQIYVNGVLVDQYIDSELLTNECLSDPPTSHPPHIGSSDIGTVRFNGTIDEVYVYNKELSGSEILDLYKRGILNITLEARSCDDPNCDGESFSGTFTNPGTNDLNVPNNRYFQYRVNFDSEDSSYTPILKEVRVGFAIE